MRWRYILYHPALKRPTKLKFEPVGWDSFNKSYSRDRRYHGVFAKYTTKLKFIKDGKAIIHALYEQYGPECEILIFIEYQHGSDRKWYRDYTGRLNLMTLSIGKLYAECNIENTGVLQKFLNREDVKVNLQSLVNLDGGAITPFTNEYISLPLHSKTIAIQQWLERVAFEGETTESVIEDNSTSSTPWRQYVQTYLNPRINEVGSYETYEDFFNEDPLIDDLKYLIKIDDQSTGSGSIVADFRVRMETFNNGNLSVDSVNQLDLIIKIKKAVDGSVTDYGVNVVPESIEDSGFLFNSGWVDVNVNIPGLTFALDDEIYYYWKLRHTHPWSESSQKLIFDLTSDNFFKVLIDSTYAETETRAVLIHEAFARVCSSILGRDDVFRSSYYGRTDSEPHAYDSDGEGSIRSIFNGFAARGFPIADRPIYASFKDLFNTGVAIDGIGAGVTVINGREYIEVEKLSHFYRAEEVLRLDYVKDVTKEVAEDYYFNELEAGYSKWANEEINNLDEFNTKKQYCFPITQVKKKLSLISPYIASGYTLEFTRRDRYIDSSTKDNSNDDENFIVQLRRSGGDFVTDIDQDFASISNVLSPDTVYNAKLSIVRCIHRNGSLIRSFLEKYRDKSIRLTFSEGNGKLVTRLSTETNSKDENANILVEDLDPPLFLPEKYGFEAVLTSLQLQSLNSNQYGYISFSESNTNHKKMFLLDAQRDPKTRKMKFKGLKANL